MGFFYKLFKCCTKAPFHLSVYFFLLLISHITIPRMIIKIGTAKVTVTFKGSNYSGSKTLKYTIGPVGTSISSIKGFSKGFEIRWKLQKVQTNGYEIQFSTTCLSDYSFFIEVLWNFTYVWVHS